MVGTYDKQNRYRKRKMEQDPEFKKKESHRVHTWIKAPNATLTAEEKESKKEKNREYMKAYRMKKKEERRTVCTTPENTTPLCLTPKSRLRQKTGYNTRSALKKAVKKLLKEAPRSPLKRKGAVAQLAKECGLVVQEPSCTGPKNLSPKALPDSTVSLVTDFYFQTNIVYTSPGLKDEMTVWKDGEKSKLRRYFLEVTLREAFALFKEQHHGVKIGFSKFAELKPVNVLHMSKAPKDQCKCVIHENFRLALKPLNVEVDHFFWPSVLCNSSDLDSPCWKGECGVCDDGKLLDILIGHKQLNDEDNVVWHSWVLEETVTKSGKEVKRITKLLKSGCIGELKEIVKGLWNSYLAHVRTKRIMSNEFQNDLTREENLIFQVDFAMDYNTQHNSREVQSAIYSRQNVTIFTAAIWHRGSWESYSVVTNGDKYKDTVRLCMLMILNDFVSKADITNVSHVIVWSDSPSSEFRNQFSTGKLLFEISQLVGKEAFWKYFATAHGKGICDGIGGALKARVAEHCRGKHRDDVMVQSYTDFHTLAKKLCPKVNVFQLSKEDVQHAPEAEDPWRNTLSIPGISKVHVAKCDMEGTIQTFKLPGEKPMKTISYHVCPTHSFVDESEIVSVYDTAFVAPADQDAAPTSTSVPIETAITEKQIIAEDVVELVDRSWYVVEFQDSKYRTNFVCQLIGVSGDKFIVNSYLKVAGANSNQRGKLFKMYPEEEIAGRSQFIKMLPAPEFKSLGRVLFDEQVCLNVK